MQLTLLCQLVNTFSKIPHLLDVSLLKMLIIHLQALSLRREALCLAAVCKLRGHVVVDDLVQLKIKGSAALLCNPQSFFQALVGVVRILVRKLLTILACLSALLSWDALAHASLRSRVTSDDKKL